MAAEAPPQTIVIGQGPVANAIAGKLASAGHNVLQVGLRGGSRADFAALVPPKQVWPLQPEAAVEAPEPARVADSIMMELGSDGLIHVSVDGQPSIVPAHIVIASSRAAARLMPQLNLKLPLRPVRCHVVMLKKAVSLAPVTYLPRGTIHALPEGGILYDGLIDPRQATFLAVPDLAVQSALEDWLARQGAEPAAAPEIATSATTPDFLPALGQWPELPQLWLGVGWHVYGPAVAGSLATKLAAMMDGEVNTDIEISRLEPARFHTGRWEKTERPAWLPEHAQPQLVGGLKEVTRADTVNTIDAPTVERGKNVQMIETPTVQRAGQPQINTRPAKGKAQVAQLGKKLV
jgi:hypothetical protein